jgi:serine/threonine-protein kinase
MSTTHQRISEYLLQEQIGAGAFGQVWRACHHVWTEQQVAIKLPTDPQYIRNLQREGTAVHGLVHPNIVRALGFDPYANPPYLVMEYVPGSSLRPLIQKRALSVPQAVNILRQVLQGLAHAHANGLVHRDVKPENILIQSSAADGNYTRSGTVKVTDFGLGHVAKASLDSIALSASLHGDEARRLAGTLDYMAPEQRTAEKTVDARADLYACGVVFYEMLTGQRPAGVELPSALNPDVPLHLDQAFARAYARLEKRFASAAEFAAALDLPPPAAATSNGRWCPGCRQAVEPADQFCMHCGLQLVAHVRRCPQCDAWPARDDQYCIHCGRVLSPVAVG